MKFSFVIPTFNDLHLLVNTLEALNCQIGFGKDDYEVIVIDDGSSSNSKELLLAVNRNYSLQYYYLERCKASCRSRARNFGIEKAKGQYIVFIDADIIIQKTYLSELSRFYKYLPDAIIVGSRIMLQEDVKKEDIQSGDIFAQKYINKTMLDFRHTIFKELSFNFASFKAPFLYALTCNMSVPKKLIDEISGFDEELIYWGIEDVEFARRLHSRGAKFVYNPRLDVLHQKHGTESKRFNSVEESKLEGVNKNTSVFLRKYPDAFPLSESQVYELFDSIASHYVLLEENHDAYYQIRLEINKESDIPVIKNLITNLVSVPDIRIILIDKVETNDFDIWLQSQIQQAGVILYFPKSQITYLSDGKFKT